VAPCHVPIAVAAAQLVDLAVASRPRRLGREVTGSTSFYQPWEPHRLGQGSHGKDVYIIRHKSSHDRPDAPSYLSDVQARLLRWRLQRPLQPERELPGMKEASR
jgi:hypothetical protein